MFPRNIRDTYFIPLFKIASRSFSEIAERINHTVICTSRLFVWAAFFLFNALACHHSISHDTGIVDIIIPLPYRIAGITLHSISSAIFALFDNAYMIGFSIIVPIEKDNAPGCRRSASCLPAPLSLKPCHFIGTEGKLRHGATRYELALIRTP